MSVATTREATERAAVTVTFLRLEATDPVPPAALPDTVQIVRLVRCTVPFYRYLNATVGGPYLWWIRRTLDDAALHAVLCHPDISVHVLYWGGEPAGMFELDARARPVVNLSYFGLMPHAVGHGFGPGFLHAAITAALGEGAQAVTVNTCTADHPRALPLYRRMGFRPTRTVREVWDIPVRLGMSIPAHVRV